MKACHFRQARSDDLAGLVEMLADDDLGRTREALDKPLDSGYASAFEAIENDPNNELIVCESQGELLGMLQITFIPYLTYIGSWRALIEGVRVASSQRGSGIGGTLFGWAIKRADSRHGVGMIGLRRRASTRRGMPALDIQS